MLVRYLRAANIPSVNGQKVNRSQRISILWCQLSEAHTFFGGLFYCTMNTLRIHGL